MGFIVTAAVVGAGAAVYGAVNSYQAAKTQKKAAEVQVQGAQVAVQAAEVRVRAAEMNVLGPQIMQSAAEQKRIAALFSGEAAARGYEFEGAVAERNATIKAQDADYARMVGEVMAQKAGLESRFRQGTAKVTTAASNIDVTRGSAVQVRESIAQIGRWNQDTIRANAGKAAFGYEAEAANLMAQKQLDLFSAANARITGAFGAKGAEFEKEAAKLAEQGAHLAVEGAKLGVEGAAKGVSAAEFGIPAAEYAGAAAIAQGIGSVSSKWMDAARVGIGTSGSTAAASSTTYDDFMPASNAGQSVF